MGGVLVALGLLGAFVAYAISQGAGGGSGSRAPSSAPVPSDLPQRLESFLASNPSPEQIEAVARELDAAGLRETASQLRAIAAQRRDGASAPSPAPSAPASGTAASPSLPPPPLPPGPTSEGSRADTQSSASEVARERTSASPQPSREAPPSPAPPPPASTREETLEDELERAGPTARESFERAMREAGPADLRVVAQGVRIRGGFPRIVAALEARATELEVAARASQGSPPRSSSSSEQPIAPSAPSPTPSPAPSAGPSTSAPPRASGAVDLGLARRLAPRVADDIRERRYSYNRDRLREFQRAAGLAADGLYGGTSRGALIHFGVRNAPPALYQPTATVRYQPPTGAASAST